MLRALAALRRRVRPGPQDGPGAEAPRREPTRMELDLYGAIVGRRLGADGDGDGSPVAPNRHIPPSLRRRRAWWQVPPAWVMDHCRALLAGIDSVFPVRGRARAAWLEVCRRLTLERGARGRPSRRQR